MKRCLCTILCMSLLLLPFEGCNRSTQNKYDAYDNVIKNLSDKGFTIEAKDVEKSILLGRRKYLTIDGEENIAVYLYESNSEMEKDASNLSDGGFGYDDGKSAVQIDWVSYPHFYKYNNIIILYVGENTEIIEALNEFAGPQFAGHIE